MVVRCVLLLEHGELGAVRRVELLERRRLLAVGQDRLRERAAQHPDLVAREHNAVVEEPGSVRLPSHPLDVTAASSPRGIPTWYQ